MKIAQILGREIYDSRGWPTVQCELILEDGTSFISSTPVGLSRGRYEAREIRDGGKRLWGQGVLKAVEHLEQIIAPELIGKEPNAVDMDMRMIEIDGTPDKSYLGSNAILAASMSIYRAQAYIEQVELYELIAYIFGAESVSIPFPLFNVINGGVHAYSNLQIQEFMIVPVGAMHFRESMELAVIVFHELKNVLQKFGKSIAFGDEGGYVAQFDSDRQVLDILMETLERVAPSDGIRCVLALDCAATQFYDPMSKLYTLQGNRLNSEELIAYYVGLTEEYPIYSIEDGLAEDDWQGWEAIMRALGDRVQIVGDDLCATNVTRISNAIEENALNSVIIKPNQVGTITETLQAIRVCKEHQLNVIISHRSGETEDTFIADLAVGTSAGQIKSGSCCRSERLAKYNRILAIEDHLAFRTT